MIGPELSSGDTLRLGMHAPELYRGDTARALADTKAGSPRAGGRCS